MDICKVLCYPRPVQQLINELYDYDYLLSQHVKADIPYNHPLL